VLTLRKLKLTEILLFVKHLGFLASALSGIRSRAIALETIT